MDNTLFELVPVSVKPEKNARQYVCQVLNRVNGQTTTHVLFLSGEGYWDISYPCEVTHYLRPLPPPVAEERILCAAIWYKELPLVNAEVLEGRGFKPYNTDTGAVVCGWRHANCILLKSALTGLKDSECGEYEQGFLTDKNRFVSREEAAKIAFVSGQITKEIKKLFSEDLY